MSCNNRHLTAGLSIMTLPVWLVTNCQNNCMTKFIKKITEQVCSQKIVTIIFKKPIKNCNQKLLTKLRLTEFLKFWFMIFFTLLCCDIDFYLNIPQHTVSPKLPSNKQHQREPSSENYLFWKLVWPQFCSWILVHFY